MQVRPDSADTGTGSLISSEQNRRDSATDRLPYSRIPETGYDCIQLEVSAQRPGCTDIA